MPNLNPNQLATLAYNAGFRGNAIKMAVAIALAESGGNPTAYNPELAAGTKPGSGSRGLWQIYGAAHPQYNSSLAFNPVTNAQAAYQVYQEAGGKFTPWSTFNNGSAAQYYNRLGNLSIGGGGSSVPVIQSMQVTGSGAVATSSPATASNPLQSLGDIASGAWVTNAASKIDFLSIGFVGLGFVLVIMGLLIMLRKPIISTASTAAKTAVSAAVL